MILLAQVIIFACGYLAAMYFYVLAIFVISVFDIPQSVRADCSSVAVTFSS